MPEPTSKRAKTDKTAKTVSPGRVEWHDFHDDPDMGVIIRSDDGVYLRATSNALKRHSSVFKDMFDLNPPTNMTVAQPIDIPYSSTVIATFLDQIASRIPVQPIAVDCENAAKYAALVKVYGCDQLVPLGNQALRDARAKWSLDWLVEACQTKNIGQARLALRQTYIAENTTERTAKRLSATLSKIPQQQLEPILEVLFGRAKLRALGRAQGSNGALEDWKELEELKW